MDQASDQAFGASGGSEGRAAARGRVFPSLRALGADAFVDVLVVSGPFTDAESGSASPPPAGTGPDVDVSTGRAHRTA